MEPKKSFFKKIHISSFKYKFGFDADSDWLFLSVVCVTLFALVSIFNIVFFFRITNQEVVILNQNEKKEEFLNQERITSLLDIYKQKEAVFNKLKNKEVVNVDEKPSPTIE